MHRNAPGTWGGVGFLIKTELLQQYTHKIIEKSYEGIFGLELIHNATSISLLLVCCYLPPENSPYGRNIDGFLSHLEQISFTYSAEYDRIIFGGDVNARIGSLSDIEHDIDINLPERKPIDLVSNSHGTSFAQFLKDCKLCVLNGRFDPAKDNFTYVSTRGKSVVDYFFCSHKTFEICSDFEVKTCTELANEYNLSNLIGHKSKLPDHSLIKVSIDILCNSCSVNPLLLSQNSTFTTNNVHVDINQEPTNTVPRYKTNVIPNDFFTSPESREKLIQLVNEQELRIESQNNVDQCYADLVDIIFGEMEKYLPKLYGTNKKTSKRFKAKKPFWNDYLKNLWQDMCAKEKEYLKYRGPNHIKQHFRKRFTDSSSLFHKDLRKAERNYNKQVQENIESICTDNPKQFWNYIKKLGPQFNSNIPQEVYDENGNIITDIDAVLNKWKTEYEKLYKPTNENFDENFYKEILGLLRNAENRMHDPLYVPNQVLNRNISADEINKVIDKLKSKKAPGLDNIPNEVLKSVAIRNCLLKLFQYYFDTGLFPNCWNRAIIKPIPKSRSKDPRIPLNDRGINLLSSVYKAYGCIINKRIVSFLENNNLLDDVQNGFRHDRNCIDHIYVLYSIIKNRKNRSLDTFVAYIDFYKCFDVIDRNLLFFKLTQYGIDGKMYDTIKCMYSNTYSRVNINNRFTDWFETNNGCRQGDVISPTAFAILINDLLKELNSCGLGVKIDANLLVSVLAFADDIVLIAENEKDLQKLIDIVHKWSVKWRFIVNPEKSQVVHYRNAPKTRTNFVFKLYESGPILEKVPNYKYLGVFLDEYLTFSKTTNILSTAGGRALGGMINKYKSLDNLGYDTYTKLYHSLVAPITDYGSAVWGFKGYDNIDKIQNRATRFFTGVHKYAPTLGHAGDMGWTSNRGRWKINILRLWNRLTAIENGRLLKKIFLWDKEQHMAYNKSNFSAHAKQLLISIGKRDSYDRTEPIDIEATKVIIADQEKSHWADNVKEKPKLDFFTSIKTEFGVEPYIKLNISRYERSLLSQLRYGILQIQLEVGRYQNENRANRLCKICNGGVIEDQQHFVLKCPAYNIRRGMFIEKIKEKIVDWDNLTDNEKFRRLFKDQPRTLARFVRDIFVYRKSLIYK